MSNRLVIEGLVSSIQGYIETLGEYKKLSQQAIVNDKTIRAAVERYLYLVSQATIDLAEAIIAYKRFRKPSTMSEAFYILAEQNLITPDIAHAMILMVGFRNIIAHEYVKINYDIVYEVLTNRLSDINKFLSIVSEKI